LLAADQRHVGAKYALANLSNAGKS
jgi:hypothetical protein